MPRLLACDLLLEDRGEQHLEHLSGAQQPQPRVAMQRVREERVARDIELAPIVTVAERSGPTPARCHSQDGILRQASAAGNTRMPSGAGPGADEP